MSDDIEGFAEFHGPVQRDARGRILMGDGMSITTIHYGSTGPTPEQVAKAVREAASLRERMASTKRAPRWAMAEWGTCSICAGGTRAVFCGIEHRHMWHAEEDADDARKRPNRHDQSRPIRDHRRPQVQGIKARRQARYYGVNP